MASSHCHLLQVAVEGLRLASWDGTPLNARAKLTDDVHVCVTTTYPYPGCRKLAAHGSAAEISQHLRWHHKASLLRAGHYVRSSSLGVLPNQTLPSEIYQTHTQAFSITVEARVEAASRSHQGVARNPCGHWPGLPQGLTNQAIRCGIAIRERIESLGW